MSITKYLVPHGAVSLSSLVHSCSRLRLRRVDVIELWVAMLARAGRFQEGRVGRREREWRYSGGKQLSSLATRHLH